jgi:monoamine oxidase
LIGTKESIVDVFSMFVSLDIITQWDEDPFSRGAYSGPTIKSLCEHFERLSEPEWDGKLEFIGEATNISYTGSAHGALLSGYEMANKIKNKINYPLYPWLDHGHFFSSID